MTEDTHIYDAASRGSFRSLIVLVGAVLFIGFAALASMAFGGSEEDGWGSARGLWLALKSGRVVLLRQLDYEIETGRAKGPVIVVDGDEAVKEGFATIAADVLASLGLDDSAVAWRPEDLEKWSADAHDLLEWWRAR